MVREEVEERKAGRAGETEVLRAKERWGGCPARSRKGMGHGSAGAAGRVGEGVQFRL